MEKMVMNIETINFLPLEKSNFSLHINCIEKTVDKYAQLYYYIKSTFLRNGHAVHLACNPDAKFSQFKRSFAKRFDNLNEKIV